MSKQPTKAVYGCFIVAGLVVTGMLALLTLSAGLFGPFQVAWHLATGFVYFLKDNLSKISTDAGTWGPGLAAFLLGLAVIHGFGRSWARRAEKAWKVSTTLAIGMLLPLLFAISFLLPGVFLQLQQLSQTPWLVRNVREASYFKHQLMMIGIHLIGTAEEDDRFPDSLETLVQQDLIKADDLFLRGQYGEMPREPVLYLGQGLSMTSDPSLPLLISPRYSEDGSMKRMLFTIGHEVVVIPDSELDEWIDKAVAAHGEAKH